ncbi:MAG: hypothetical protein DRO04_00840 [Candidatus Iainarchaeum archaeon]|uniref:Uncharacterized protein n=1 Tax=Candidatus Iainarchaeum sp. TaxID=3101447 RepID=A0A497JKV7_9ARCH|nr:MAG: hypothetical protein DRO04_00840 [Candidatus Diapherotrites archaeon]
MQLPESAFVRKDFMLRQLDFPPEVRLTKKSLLRWFALALGLISLQESRTSCLDVLDALFTLTLNKKMAPTTLDIQNFIKEKYNKEISEKLIRYHLSKLISLELLQRKKNRYYWNNAPNAEKNNLAEAFEYWVGKGIKETLQNTKDALKLLVEKYE